MRKRGIRQPVRRPFLATPNAACEPPWFAFGDPQPPARHSSIKTTPAVVAGIADEQWTIETLIERTACYDLPTAGEQFIDSLPYG